MIKEKTEIKKNKDDYVLYYEHINQRPLKKEDIVNNIRILNKNLEKITHDLKILTIEKVLEDEQRKKDKEKEILEYSYEHFDKLFHDEIMNLKKQKDVKKAETKKRLHNWSEEVAKHLESVRLQTEELRKQMLTRLEQTKEDIVMYGEAVKKHSIELPEEK